MYIYNSCNSFFEMEIYFQKHTYGVYIEDDAEIEKMVNDFNKHVGKYLKINLEEAKKSYLEIKSMIDKTINKFGMCLRDEKERLTLTHFSNHTKKLYSWSLIDRSKLIRNSNYIKKQLKRAFYYIDFTESDKLEAKFGDKYYSSEMFGKFIYTYLENNIGKIGPETTKDELIKLLTPTLESIEILLEVENGKGFGLAHRVFHTFYEIEDVRNYIDVYYVVVQKEIFYELLGEKTKKYFLFLREFL